MRKKKQDHRAEEKRKQENVLRQAVKNGLPLAMFPFLGSLPKTTNLVLCICGGRVNYQMHW